MIKRTIYIGNPSYLRLKDGQLLVQREQKTIGRVPVEDIALLVIDHPQVSMSQGIVNACLANNAAVMYCDASHLPNGLLLPLYGHHSHTQKARYQLEASKPSIKRLWKQIVKQKIQNQGRILDYLGYESETLFYLSKTIQSGDRTNAEAQAAAYYWRRVLAPFSGVRRGRFEGPPNHLLNYGYAILRSVMARSVVGSGCIPSVGLHHRNKYNPFCLADDMIEPFRPIVDRYVIDFINSDWSGEDQLTQQDKRYLLNIPTIDVTSNTRRHPLMIACQHASASLMQCFEGSRESLNLPIA